jgi:hypothetical protein
MLGLIGIFPETEIGQSPMLVDKVSRKIDTEPGVQLRANDDSGV